MTARRIYLDYNAGAPLRPEARAAMVAALGSVGNASSVHAEGRRARQQIEASRAEVAALVGADPRRVTFTSGGTEANATVLGPEILIGGRRETVHRLLFSATEHPSVTAGGQFPADRIEAIPVDANGLVDLSALAERHAALAAAGERALVSVMLANNETGAIQPVAEIARIAHEHGALVHTDAIQAAGRVPIAIGELGVDFLTLSAHKIGGPQGAGAVVARSQNVDHLPLQRGGGQESGHRAGTENVAAIAGFGAAAKAALLDLSHTGRWREWRDRLIAAARQIGPIVVFAEPVDRLPQTVCFGVAGASAETAVIGLDLEGVAVSSGAACSSGKVGPSHVLAAMGVPPELARSAIRVSFGWETGENELDMFQTAWQHVVGRILKGKAA